MRHGDLALTPPSALAFHWDCLFQPKKKMGTLMESMGGALSLFWNQKLRLGAAQFSQRLLHMNGDYHLILVYVGSNKLFLKDPVGLRHRLEDEYGFVAARLMAFSEEADLREFLSTSEYVELYYDSNEERLARIAIRARVFQGWDHVGR